MKIYFNKKNIKIYIFLKIKFKIVLYKILLKNFPFKLTKNI